jgi:lipopolysaccharide assembly outer membrane protein LptD (OstA)
MGKLQTVLLSALLFLSLSAASAQDVSGRNPVVIDAEHSDIILSEGDRLEIHYYNDVRLEYKGAELFCDTAVWYQSESVMEFWGEVRYADSIHELSSEHLLYDQLTDEIQAEGDCELVDKNEDVRIRGNKVDYDRSSGDLVVSQMPMLSADYDDPAAMIEISGDTLYYQAETRRGKAVNNVRIVKGGMAATCELCDFFPDSNLIVLLGHPKAEQRLNELNGDTMRVLLKNRLLDEIQVFGNGKALYRKPTGEADSLYTESRIEARKISFALQNEVLREIVSAGNSYSWYTPSPEDTVAEGKNEASGDSILLHFGHGGLQDVEINNSCIGKFFSQMREDSAGEVVYLDTVSYQSSRLAYNTDDRVIHLLGAATVNNKTITLTADTITYNTATHDLRASSSLRTSGSDSVYVPVVLRDGPEEMLGEKLAYNLDTKRGKIRKSDTELEKAYYHGNVVRKVDEDMLLVDHGRYTTCDMSVPHFHFGSNRMKIINDDRVIARPLVLYIEGIPVFYAPYFVFSIKKGRHSGFLPFRIGSWDRGGRYVENLGYYWAASEYWDLASSMDLRENVGLKFDAKASYAKRYVMSGQVSGSYARDSRTNYFGRTIANRWSLSANHSHTLSPTASLAGSGSFVSDKSYTTETSNDVNERLNRNLRSQLNFSKRWEQTYVTAVIQSTRNLDDESSTLTLPAVTFALGSRAIFGAADRGDTTRQSWYRNTRISQSSDFRNYASKQKSGGDFLRTEYAKSTHNMSVSSPQKMLKYVTVNPSLSYTENWFLVRSTNSSSARNLRTEKLLRSWTSSASVGANTTVYGYLFPPIPNLIGIRHSLTPGLGFSYRPKSDLNRDEASFVGAGSSSTEQKSLSVSVSQLLQMKYKSGETEKKLDLFTLNSSASYNFEQERRKWSRVSSSLQTRSIPRVSVSLQFTHDLYNPITEELDLFNPRLTDIGVSSSFSTSGMSGSTSQQQSGIGETPRQMGSKPWSLSIGHRYSENRNLVTGDKSITHWITSSAHFKLTENWDIDIQQNYDIRREVIVSRSINVVRDMHCWEARFTWNPNGSLKGYYFNIYVKQIPDIKFEKSQSPLRGTLFD